MGERTCKRCSVTRVNTLCAVYEKAHQNNDPKAWHGLREVSDLAKSRGYDEGSRLLKPGLANQQLRAFCWNVSSFLGDEEMKRIFGWLPKAKKEK
jgi:hypothetical protein